MKIKLISDGTLEGTKVVDKETGDPLEWVDEVNFVAKTEGPAKGVKLMLSLEQVEVEVESEIEFDEED